MNVEDYIKDLDPELQEKARACGSADELLALAREHKVALPDEVFEAVAGGDGPNPENCGNNWTCPKCGSTRVSIVEEKYGIDDIIVFGTCNDCGYHWKADY